MGAKRASRKRHNSVHNVVDFDIYKKKNQVNILPRNINQETYMLKLLDREKDIIFGIGPAGTGKTLIAVQVAVKLFRKELLIKSLLLTCCFSAGLGFFRTGEQKGTGLNLF